MSNTGVTLGAFIGTVFVVVPAGWHSLDADLATDGKHYDHELGPDQSMTVRFVVVPKTKLGRKVTFAASAFAYDDAPGPVTAGAMEARTFTVHQANPSVAEN